MEVDTVGRVEISALLCTPLSLQRATLSMADSAEVHRSDVVAMSALHALSVSVGELIRLQPEIEPQVTAQIDQLVQVPLSFQALQSLYLLLYLYYIWLYLLL